MLPKREANLRNLRVGQDFLSKFRIYLRGVCFVLAKFAFGARAKYVKPACVASAAVSSCKFQEAYKVDRELNE